MPAAKRLSGFLKGIESQCRHRRFNLFIIRRKTEIYLVQDTREEHNYIVTILYCPLVL